MVQKRLVNVIQNCYFVIWNKLGSGLRDYRLLAGKMKFLFSIKNQTRRDQIWDKDIRKDLQVDTAGKVYQIKDTEKNGNVK
jgi:hypothetical protein